MELPAGNELVRKIEVSYKPYDRKVMYLLGSVDLINCMSTTS
jgi:hypothetical protein